MHFQRIIPPASLSPYVECYWTAEDESTAAKTEKIIPDGFVEIIFHFADPYRIRLGAEWQTQTKSLVGGQITRHFLLENTGTTDIVAAKLRPTALTHWFGIPMHSLTDKVHDLVSVIGKPGSDLYKKLTADPSVEDKIATLNSFFSKLPPSPFDSPVDRAVDLLMNRHGMIRIAELSEQVGVGERQLENLFRKFVGLSPKLFSRILRFRYIFDHVKKDPASWSDIAYEASFYDQSHFIRNFRDFTGENPGNYGFDEKTMANFFLIKK